MLETMACKKEEGNVCVNPNQMITKNLELSSVFGWPVKIGYILYYGRGNNKIEGSIFEDRIIFEHQQPQLPSAGTERTQCLLNRK